MSHWNHRVYRHTHTNGDTTYGIHEAYYDSPDEEPPGSYTAEPVEVVGDSIEDLREELQRMLRCLERPVLDYPPKEKAPNPRFRFIRFEEVPSSGKTKRWEIRTPKGFSLGSIAWYSPWRCYAIETLAGILFEHKCLRDIAAFCEERTREQRATWKQQKEKA